MDLVWLFDDKTSFDDELQQELVDNDVTVVITAGSVIWSGQTVTANLTVPVTAASITWAGQTVTPTRVTPVTAGSASWSGQTVTASPTVPITAGSATWTGQSVTVSIATVVPVTRLGRPLTFTYAVTRLASWTGQTVTPRLTRTSRSPLVRRHGRVNRSLRIKRFRLPPDRPGRVVCLKFTTQSPQPRSPGRARPLPRSIATVVPVTAGSDHMVGQSVAANLTVPVIAGSVTGPVGVTVTVGGNVTVGVTAGSATGQTVTTKSRFRSPPVRPPSPAKPSESRSPRWSRSPQASPTWTGQAVALKFTFAVTTATVTWQGQTVSVLRIIPVTAGSALWQGQAVNILVPTIIPVTPGSIVWQGQSLTVIIPGAGTPVDDPQAEWLGPEGKGVLVGVGAQASWTQPEGKAKLVGTNGKAVWSG